MTEWTTVTLAELGLIVTGKTPPTAKEGCFGGDIPFVTPSDMDGQRFVDETGRSLTTEGLRTVAKRPIPAGAILVSCIGSDMGKTHIAGRDCFTNQQINSIAVANPNAHPLYVYYNLSARKEEFQRLAAGSSAQPILNKSSFSRMGISLPPMDMQTVAVELLGSLDDKIELNRRMNETLEAMAQAIFRDWFVDFGPTRRKLEGATDPVTIMGGLVTDPARAKELADLFPATLGDDGVPEGWRDRPFTSFIDIVGGGTPKTSVSDYWSGTIPWFSVVDSPPAGTVFVLATEKNVTERAVQESSARIVRAGTTIISARGTVGKLAVTPQPMTFNQSCYGLQGRDQVGDWFVFLASQHVVERLRGMAHGSVFSTITRQTFKGVSLCFPSGEALAAFEATVGVLFEKIKANGYENRTLAATRDLLLPKLMSGEARASEEVDA